MPKVVPDLLLIAVILHISASIYVEANGTVININVGWPGSSQESYLDVLHEASPGKKAKQFPSYGWVPGNANTAFPKNAVRCCTGPDDNDVYFGQALADTNYVVGAKIIPAIHKTLYAHGDKEFEAKKYMVLVNNAPYSRPVWVSARNGHVPPDAVFIGYNSAGRSLYVGRAFHNGFMVPGYVVPEDGLIWLGLEGKTYSFAYYEVLVNRAE